VADYGSADDFRDRCEAGWLRKSNLFLPHYTGGCNERSSTHRLLPSEEYPKARFLPGIDELDYQHLIVTRGYFGAKHFVFFFRPVVVDLDQFIGRSTSTGSLRDAFDAHPALAFVASHLHIFHAFVTFCIRHEDGKRDSVVTFNELLTKRGF